MTAPEARTAAAAAPPDTDRTAGERGFDGPQHRHRQRALARRRAGEAIEQRILLAHEVGKLGERPRQARVQLARQRRQEAVPDPGALQVEIEVAVVATPLLSLRDEESAYLHAVAIEERPDDPSPPRPDSREAAAARTTDHAQEYRLGLIVARVAGSDFGRAELARNALEEGVADAPGLGLEVASGDHGFFADARNRVAASDLLDEGTVTGTLAPADAVIEVGSSHSDAESVTERQQSKQQRQRIGATRDRRHHDIAGDQELVPADVRAHRLDQPQRHGALKSRRTRGLKRHAQRRSAATDAGTEWARIREARMARSKLRPPAVRANITCMRSALVAAMLVASMTPPGWARADAPTPAPAAALDELPSAKPRDVARLLRKVRQRHGEDAVIVQTHLLLNAMQKGAVLATGVRVERVEEAHGKRWLRIVLETGFVFDDSTRDRTRRAQILWSTIMEPTLARLNGGLRIENADGVLVEMQSFHRPYRSAAELRAHIHEPGASEAARFYVASRDVDDVVRDGRAWHTLLAAAHMTIDGEEIAVPPPSDDEALTPGPE